MKKLILVLFLITAITALALGGVNYITAGIIAERNAERAAEAMKEVLPEYVLGEFNADWLTNLEFDGSANPLVKGVYNNNETDDAVYYVVEVVPSGFGGDIDIMVGLTWRGMGTSPSEPQYEVTGVAIVSMSETSGLGDNAKDPEWREQFIGVFEAVAVDKDGGNIDALTGATITSRAVTDGVNAAIAVVEEAEVR
jgi:electron transport complex protein RnfG